MGAVKLLAQTACCDPWHQFTGEMIYLNLARAGKGPVKGF